MAATQAQIDRFINEVAPCAQYAFKTLGKVLPSVCIGMACIESGYGTSKIMYNYHAVLGQKVGTGKTATKYWGGRFFVAKTKEEYVVGQHTVIKDAFRSYDDLQQCVLNYYELLNTSLYKKVKAGADYKTPMQQIKACGYMTSSTEVDSVIYRIQKSNLARFDTVDCYDEILPAQPILRKGDCNEFVRAWQIYLNAHGYDVGKSGCDGKFGNDTERAVMRYQQDHGIEAGYIGPQTWETI